MMNFWKKLLTPIGIISISLSISAQSKAQTSCEISLIKEGGSYYYLTSKDDSLAHMAALIYGNPQYATKIAKWNDIDSPYLLEDGQKLILKDRFRYGSRKPFFKLVKKWPKKFSLRDEKFKKKLPEEDTNQIAVLEMQAHIAKNNHDWQGFYRMLEEILEIDPYKKTTYDMIINILKKDQPFKQIHFYKNLIEVYHDGNIWEANPGTINQRTLGYLLEIAILYTGLMKGEKHYNDLKDHYFYWGERYFRLLEKHDYRPFNYYFNREQLYLFHANYFESFQFLYDLRDSDKFEINEQIEHTLDFFDGMSLVKSGNAGPALRKFEKIQRKIPEEGLGKSSKSFIKSLTKPGFSGFVSFSRGYSSNIAGLKDDDPLKENHSLTDSAYSKSLLGINYNNLRLSDKILVDFGSLGLINHLDLLKYQAYSYIFAQASIKFKFLSVWNLPKIGYSVSRLLLRQDLDSDGAYHYESYSLIQDLRFDWNIPFRWGLLKFGLPINYTTEDQNKDQDNVTPKTSFIFKIWRINSTWAPSISFYISRKIYTLHPYKNEWDRSLSLRNKSKFGSHGLSLMIGLDENTADNLDGTELNMKSEVKWSRPFKIMKQLILPNISFKAERKKNRFPHEYINNLITEASLLIPF